MTRGVYDFRTGTPTAGRRPRLAVRAQSVNSNGTTSTTYRSGSRIVPRTGDAIVGGGAPAGSLDEVRQYISEREPAIT